MEAHQVQTFDDSHKFPPLSLENNNYKKSLSPIRTFKMDLKEDHLEVKIRVEGLWGKNYKIEVVDGCLTLTVLRYLLNDKSNGRKPKGKFRWMTSSFFLPYHVNEGIIDSELKAGYLWIRIPKKGKTNVIQMPSLKDGFSDEKRAINK